MPDQAETTPVYTVTVTIRTISRPAAMNARKELAEVASRHERRDDVSHVSVELEADSSPGEFAASFAETVAETVVEKLARRTRDEEATAGA